MFLSAKNSPCGSHPDGLTPKYRIYETRQTYGRTAAAGQGPKTGIPHNPPPRHGTQTTTSSIGPCCRTAAHGSSPPVDCHQSCARGLRREHLDCMSQLKGVARNLNQLTRLAHTKEFTGIVSRHAAIVASIEILLKNLRDDR